MKQQGIWEMPKWHSEGIFLSLERYFKNSSILTSSQGEIFLIFRLKQSTMTRTMALIKAGRWKKKGEKKACSALASTYLSVFLWPEQAATSAAQPPPGWPAASWGNCAGAAEGHQPPTLDTQYNPHQWLTPSLLRKCWERRARPHQL